MSRVGHMSVTPRSVGRALKEQARFEILRNLSRKTLKGQLADEYWGIEISMSTTINANNNMHVA